MFLMRNVRQDYGLFYKVDNVTTGLSTLRI